MTVHPTDPPPPFEDGPHGGRDVVPSPWRLDWSERQARPRRRPQRRVHLMLLLATMVSTTLIGSVHYQSFLSDFGAQAPELSWLMVAGGVWYSATILAILGAHEMGHYVACRHYDVDATLPYFLPAPILTGTLGAVIRIRDAFPTKAILFDIGIAGPIAGFVVTVPALFIGLILSRLAPLPPDFVGYSLGEPLLFKMAAWMVWGSVPDGYSVSMHPMAFAAWFGLIATALNLIPFGQLDGGHISYAVLDRRSTALSLVTVALAIGLMFFSLNWVVWVIIMMVMLLIAGPGHPRVIHEQVPLDARRRRLAWAAVAMFILCFTPVPIEPYELIRSR